MVMARVTSLLLAVVLGVGVFMAPVSADTGSDSGDGWLGEASYDDSAYFWDANWWELIQATPIGPCPGSEGC